MLPGAHVNVKMIFVGGIKEGYPGTKMEGSSKHAEDPEGAESRVMSHRLRRRVYRVAAPMTHCLTRSVMDKQTDIWRFLG